MSGLRSHLRAAAAAVALAWCAVPGVARAGSPFLEASDPAEAMASPAYRYANMTNEEAFGELDRRKILYVREQPTHGVRAPIRLTGRLHGVHVHSSLPPEARPTTPFEILDARLALAVDDFCAILERHDVDELVHYTMYRPNVPPPGAAASRGAPTKAPSTARESRKGAKRKAGPKTSLDKGTKTGGKKGSGGRSRARRKVADEGEALEPKPGFGDDAFPGHALVEAAWDDHLHDHDHDARAKAAPSKGRAGKGQPPKRVEKTSRRTAAPLRRPPSRSEDGERRTHRNWAPPGTRHPAGLAIDLGALRKRDGRWLSIAGHFDGKIGQRTCGVGAPTPVSAEARELRAIVCEARTAGVFTYALTPNFDADHVDHVHFEIKPGVTWFLFH